MTPTIVTFDCLNFWQNRSVSNGGFADRSVDVVIIRRVNRQAEDDRLRFRFAHGHGGNVECRRFMRPAHIVRAFRSSGLGPRNTALGSGRGLDYLLGHRDVDPINCKKVAAAGDRPPQLERHGRSGLAPVPGELNRLPRRHGTVGSDGMRHKCANNMEILWQHMFYKSAPHPVPPD